MHIKIYVGRVINFFNTQANTHKIQKEQRPQYCYKPNYVIIELAPKPVVQEAKSYNKWQPSKKGYKPLSRKAQHTNKQRKCSLLRYAPLSQKLLLRHCRKP